MAHGEVGGLLALTRELCAFATGGVADDNSGGSGRDEESPHPPALIDRGQRLRAVPVEGGWLEIDSLRDLEVGERLAVHGRLD